MQPAMQLISVNVGLPAWRVRNTKRVLTGGDKQPVDAAQIEAMGFAGDEATGLRSRAASR